MKRKHHIISYVILAAIIILLLILSLTIPSVQKLSSPEFVRNFLISMGAFGYIVLIILITLSVPLPIPSTPLVLSGGYVYGPVLGTLLALIGNIFGATIGFYLVRSFGEPLLEKMVDRNHLIHLNHLMKKRGPTAALISYFIPLFPSDSVSMILGLSTIKYHVFLLLLIVGHIPRYLVLNSIGNDLHAGFTLQTIALLAIGILFVLIAIFREPIKRSFFKELKEVEHEIEVVEKEIGLKKK